MIHIYLLQSIYFDNDYCYYWDKIQVTPHQLKQLLDECNTIKLLQEE